MNILRRLGNLDEIVVSASRLVVMYLEGSTGAPPAAEMYVNVGTFSFADSCARAIALLASVQYYIIIGQIQAMVMHARTRVSVHKFIGQLSIPFLGLQ